MFGAFEDAHGVVVAGVIGRRAIEVIEGIIAVADRMETLRATHGATCLHEVLDVLKASSIVLALSKTGKLGNLSHLVKSSTSYSALLPVFPVRNPTLSTIDTVQLFCQQPDTFVNPDQELLEGFHNLRFRLFFKGPSKGRRLFNSTKKSYMS